MAISGRAIGTLPASDIARAKDFYAKNLGLKPAQETAEGVIYECAEKTQILLFPSAGRASGTHTQASFEVQDVEAEVAAMRERGVVFEEYDLPDFKTKNGILNDGPIKAAYFKDSEGNLICLSEPMPS